MNFASETLVFLRNSVGFGVALMLVLGGTCRSLRKALMFLDL